MKIHFSKKEYRLLLDMLGVADWIMNSHIVPPDEGHKAHDELKSKLMSHYKEMGAEDIIEHDEQLNGYYELNAYEEYLHDKFIDPYDDETFWEELIDRLSERDLVSKIGEEALCNMDAMKRMKHLGEISDFYAQEFEEHGLSHLHIKKMLKQ